MNLNKTEALEARLRKFRAIREVRARQLAEADEDLAHATNALKDHISR